MKLIKQSLSLLASGMMALSPTANAAIDAQQKNYINTVIQEFQKSNFREIYNRYGIIMDSKSRGQMEQWLKNFGSKKIDSLQAQPLKGAKGSDVLKLVMNFQGRSLTLTMDDADWESVDINGSKFKVWELTDGGNVFHSLAKTDKTYRDIEKQWAQPGPENDMIKEKTEAFLKMSKDQQLEYLMMLRQVRESSEDVINASQSSQVSENFETTRSFVFHPLLAAQLAYAEGIPKIGEMCGVAGNLRVYENGEYFQTNAKGVVSKTKGIHCAAFPSSDSTSKPLPTYSESCEESSDTAGPGQRIACPPLLYGTYASAAGEMKPYCQNTARPHFTETATKFCGDKSPLPGTLGSPERIAASRKILESYAKLKSTDSSKVMACFNDKNQIHNSQECKSIFEPIFKEQEDYKKIALAQCNPPDLKQKTKDQKYFCEELEKRVLSMDWFSKNAIAGPGISVNRDAELCSQAGGTLIAGKNGTKVCQCNGKSPEEASTSGVDSAELKMTAKDPKTGQYKKCEASPAIAHLAPVEDRVPRPVQHDDKCKNENEKSSLSCNIGPLVLFGGLAALALFSTRGSTKSNPPTWPPQCGPGMMYLCINWSNEGGNGKSGGTGSSGSVRGGGIPTQNIGTPATGTK